MNRAGGTLRIIGGAWRSRVIAFAPGEGVRPTPDRVRQTLFDWLAPCIEGARCLDLFAGSGALGLEALSRGAARVEFVEQNRAQADAIARAIGLLHAQDRAILACADAMSWLDRALGGAHAPALDVVFLDPPYATDLLARALPLLPALLRPGNRIYLEHPVGQTPQLPEGYEWLREKKAGRVSFGLITYTQGAAP